ncbi:hypothetical protein BC629DRAFT_1578219 [Irpex lacteus]|nr:hypothetical protein BC629DRAFT_1578219 [Irpex lacteus]
MSAVTYMISSSSLYDLIMRNEAESGVRCFLSDCKVGRLARPVTGDIHGHALVLGLTIHGD